MGLLDGCLPEMPLGRQKTLLFFAILTFIRLPDLVRPVIGDSQLQFAVIGDCESGGQDGTTVLCSHALIVYAVSGLLHRRFGPQGPCSQHNSLKRTQNCKLFRCDLAVLNYEFSSLAANEAAATWRADSLKLNFSRCRTVQEVLQPGISGFARLRPPNDSMAR